MTVHLVLIATLILGAALWLARLRQHRALAALMRSIETAARTARPRSAGIQASETLPAPVARYLGHVLPAQSRWIRLARYEQSGSLRTGTRNHRWMPFTAAQVVAPGIPAFVWDAKVRFLPFLHVRVRDSLLHGRGAGQVSLLSALPISGAGGNPEINAGALHRFLAEAVWYPTALQPSPLLCWEPIDDTRASAALTCGGICVSLEFRFNEHHEVAGIYTPARWGSFEGGYRQVAWEGRFADYAEHDGVLVPTRGEVGWHDAGEWHAVWRGSIAAAMLEFE